MNITKDQIDELNAVVKIRLTPEDYQVQVEKSLKDYGKKVNLPGFRPGKVPFGMVKKMYGKSVLLEEINKLLSDSLYKYLSENKIEILGSPLPKEKEDAKIDWDHPENFEFSYDLGLAPRFEIDLSPRQSFDYLTIKVDEELVQKHIDDISKRYGKMASPEVSETTDILFGEFIELDAQGNPLEGGVVKASSIFIERVKDENAKKNLTGLKKDDKVVLDPRTLSDNETDLAAMLGITKEQVPGISSGFRFTLNNITRMEPAELNQDLFDKIYGEGNTVSEADFRLKMGDDIKAMFQGDIDNRLFNHIADALVQNLKISLPDEFLKRWMVAVSEKPVTLEQVSLEYDNYSKGLRWQLIENKIIKEHHIEVPSDELMDYIKELIKGQYVRYGRTDVGDEELTATAKKVLENKEEVKKIYEKIYDKKILELFKKSFTLINKEVSLDEFINLSKKNQ